MIWEFWSALAGWAADRLIPPLTFTAPEALSTSGAEVAAAPADAPLPAGGAATNPDHDDVDDSRDPAALEADFEARHPSFRRIEANKPVGGYR